MPRSLFLLLFSVITLKHDLPLSLFSLLCDLYHESSHWSIDYCYIYLSITQRSILASYLSWYLDLELKDRKPQRKEDRVPFKLYGHNQIRVRKEGLLSIIRSTLFLHIYEREEPHLHHALTDLTNCVWILGEPSWRNRETEATFGELINGYWFLPLLYSSTQWCSKAFTINQFYPPALYLSIWTCSHTQKNDT